MSCQNCARKTLGLFIRSIVTGPIFASGPAAVRTAHSSRPFSTDRRPHNADAPASRPSKPPVIYESERDAPRPARERPAWQIQKEALKEKLGGEAWNPRKKLSPDTMEGIRHLNSTDPAKFTTPVLAEHFKVAPEAIRRILKSKWRPSDEEYDARMERWNRRGERIWSNLVEMGVKPPKVWRDMGVGRARNGERPKWKSRHRNMVPVHDSARDDFVVEEGDILPIVDDAGSWKKSRQRDMVVGTEDASDSLVAEDSNMMPVVNGHGYREARRVANVPLSERL